jgi:hypothetical protein
MDEIITTTDLLPLQFKMRIRYSLEIAPITYWGHLLLVGDGEVGVVTAEQSVRTTLMQAASGVALVLPFSLRV